MAAAGQLSLAALSAPFALLQGDGTARQAAEPPGVDHVVLPSASAAAVVDDCENPQCDDCENPNHATHHCTDPRCLLDGRFLKLCDGCCAEHRRRKTLKHHVLVPLDRSPPTSSASSSQTPRTVQRPGPRGGGGAARSLPFRDNDTESDTGGDITESDSDADDSSTLVYDVSIPCEPRLLEKDEGVLVQQMFDELPDAFLERCNHDVKHQITCIIRKYKTAYTGNGRWGQLNVDAMPEIIAGGVTQNGKTMIKAVGIWLAWRLGAGHPDAPKIATILLSTTKNGTESLCSKLIIRIFNQFPANLRPPIVFAGSAPISNLEHRENLIKCVAQGGCIVLNDTAARVHHARSAVLEARGRALRTRHRPQVQIFMDEADAFYRNKENPIKLEKAVDELMQDTRPILRMSVSATLIPVFLHLQEKKDGVDVNSIIYTEPGGDYIGVQDFRPPVDAEGQLDFLRPGDLTKANGYFNAKVAALYRTAFAAPKSLVLNITNPGVATSNNVYDHAARVQRDYDHVGCIVFVGKGITYYPPKRENRGEERFQKGWTIGRVIKHVDDNDGLETPLVVIGYSQMLRGDSFRSDCRVPTHICCALGTAMSIEKMVQAMGRATYGDSMLQENGFTHVTVLTFANDYDTAQAYPIWLKEMEAKIKSGMTIQQALSADALYTDKANVTLGQNRTIGQKNDRLVLGTSFAKPEAGQEREGAVWRQQEILKDPMNKLVLDVAKEHFTETLDNFNADMRQGEQSFEYGGTSEDFLAALEGVDGVPDAARDIRKVKAALEALARLGELKKSSAFAPVRGAPVRYFIADRQDL